jgi:hypothetical protein
MSRWKYKKCSQGPYRAVHSATRVRLKGIYSTLYYNLGEGGPGF